jgi:NAD(P)-dependent dehydrogenase (short-subunit alcohol dehydrogenase family)
MNSEQIEGRHAFVTGVGRGIGLAIAADLMQAGAKVTVEDGAVRVSNVRLLRALRTAS